MSNIGCSMWPSDPVLSSKPQKTNQIWGLGAILEMLLCDMYITAQILPVFFKLHLTSTKHRNLSQNESDPTLQHERWLVIPCFGWPFLMHVRWVFLSTSCVRFGDGSTPILQYLEGDEQPFFSHFGVHQGPGYQGASTQNNLEMILSVFGS
jgi:hypothetical protein